MKYPKVSIITVTYNAAEALRVTLDNILRSNLPELEVLVIDGASTDHTASVVQAFGDRVRFVSEPDSGIYEAMNKGLRGATGEYVWFINAGDLIHQPESITRIFDTAPELADIYYGETLIRSEQGQELGLRKKKLPEAKTWTNFRRGMVVCHQSILVRRTIAPQYDLKYRYAADIEWVLLALQRAQTIVNTHTILSEFVTGGTSTVHRKACLHERYAIMKHHFGTLPTTWAHLRFLFDALKPAYRRRSE
ncbi:MAG: glycosyltransferase [Rikenellaceae bacterium]|jgi:glycosyltransferase involved in cell wall biosynthesis|nr:glycosyltransferase [Rikenellaceae bacterium]